MLEKEGVNTVDMRLKGFTDKIKYKIPASPAGGLDTRYKKIIFAFVFFLSTLFSLLSTPCNAQGYKQPVVAGLFYPKDPVILSNKIDQFLSQSKPPAIEGDIKAIIVPHAGYDYSGRVAAFAYNVIKGKPYKTVIILGPSHYLDFKGASVYPEGTFITPLGSVKIDSLAKRLIDKNSTSISFIEEAFSKEHSVEVQIPFLQKVLRGFEIVPVVIGYSTDFAACQEIASKIGALIQGRDDVLIVASTDMYHGYNYQQANSIDESTLNAIQKMDPRNYITALYLISISFAACVLWLLPS